MVLGGARTPLGVLGSRLGERVETLFDLASNTKMYATNPPGCKNFDPIKPTQIELCKQC